MDQDERKAPVERARHAFFAERAEEAKVEWRAGRGRAVALKRAIDGGRLVRIVIPPQAQPGDYIAHRGVKGHPIKRTTDGDYVESKEEDMWEQEPDARSDEATPAFPIGPVPNPRPDSMIITVWARGLRRSEAAKAAAEAAEAVAWDEQVAWDFDDDDEADDDYADDESDDEEEGGAEEGGVEEGDAAPTAAAPAIAPAAAPAASSVVATAPTTALAAPIAVAAPTAALVPVAADANARIEAAVEAAVAAVTQTGVSGKQKISKQKIKLVRCLHLPPPPNPKP